MCNVLAIFPSKLLVQFLRIVTFFETSTIRDTTTLFWLSIMEIHFYSNVAKTMPLLHKDFKPKLSKIKFSQISIKL